MLSGSSSSKMFAMSAYSSPTAKVKRVRRDPPARSLRPRSLYTEGGAPRCPNPPPGLYSTIKPKRSGLDNPKCGWLQSTLATVATAVVWEMGDCCEEHIDCYANCASESWESCNKQFYDCMNINICAKLTASPSPPNWFVSVQLYMTMYRVNCTC